MQEEQITQPIATNKTLGLQAVNDMLESGEETIYVYHLLTEML